jgi:hypothetical protein
MAVSKTRTAKRPAFKTLEEEVEWFETHDSWDDDDEELAVVGKVPLDTVVPVRVTGDVWRALHREAKELGVGPTTLARMWIMEKLRAVEAGRRTRRVGEERTEYVATPRKKASTRKAAAKRTPAAKPHSAK